MKISCLSNSGKTNLGNEIDQNLAVCQSFDIATAFISSDTISTLEQFLTGNKTQMRFGRLLTGLYLRFNKKKHLEALKSIAIKLPKRIRIHISLDNSFHWKYYNFNLKGISTSYVGSANFTESGMNNTGEMLLKLKQPSKQSICNATFEKAWSNSIDIRDINFDDYTEAEHSNVNNINIKNLINQTHFSASTSDKNIVNKKTKARLIVISGALSVKTVRTVSSRKTNWDKYDYFTCDSKKDYTTSKEAGYYFIVSKIKRNYSFVIAKYQDDDIIETTDGDYFIAYTESTRTIRETKKILKILSELKINHRSRTLKNKAIGAKQFEAIQSAF